MTQTYPAVLPSTAKVQDGTALVNPTPTNATIGTSPADVFHPNVWADRSGIRAGPSAGPTCRQRRPIQTSPTTC
jgi:hypothetical protein